MKYFLSALLLAFAVSSSMAAKASVEDGTHVSPSEVAPLMAWVERATQVHLPATPIITASNRILKTALGLEGAQAARSAAAYLPGQIIISNYIWDPDSVTAKSYLVHELVHHAQLLGGRHYACHDAKEREAYMLQNQWLAEQGERPLVTQGWIDQIASCSH